MAAALWAAGAGAVDAVPASFPDRTVQVIVPYTAGGNTDRFARILSQRLSQAWGKSVVVENKPGAAGTIGAALVAKAKPDGHVLFLGAFGNVLTARALYRHLPYDPEVDLAPISLLSTPPAVVTVPAAFPARDIASLIDYARAHPGAINYGSSGSGTSNHLYAELFSSMAGVRMTHVAYKGSGTAITDLIAGTTQLNFAPFPSVLSHVRAGELKALAVTGSTRSPLLPEVPTVAEAGLPGYEGLGWFALMAPGGTPRPIIDRINADVDAILKRPEVIAEFRQEGADPVGGSPERARQSVKEGIAKWSALIREIKLSIE